MSNIKKEVFDQIAEKTIDLLNDSGELNEILRDNGFKEWEDVPSEIQDHSLVVISYNDLEKIKEAFPDIIIGGA